MRMTSATVPTAARGQYRVKKLLRPALTTQGQHQLQRYAAAGQMFEGIGAIRSVGIHHRRSPGQLILTLMMVRHHHIHTDGGGKIHLLHAGDAAIHSDHQVNAPVVQGTHGVHGEAIAILDAAGGYSD